jgi:hypothetical protein
VWLAQWAALAALYDLALHRALHVAPPGDWLGALAGAFFLRLALGALANAARAAEDRRVLARARSGALPQDGKRFAAVGAVAALAAPLAAPFSRTPCVAYSYQIGGQAPGEDGGSALSHVGFALTPAAIAAPAGSVRLLGFPLLESGFAATVLGGDAAFAHAAAYVATTAFESLGLAQAGKIFGEAAALVADVQGAVRKDWRVGDREIDRGDRLAETVVPEGEEVCAIGLYRAAEGGVTPDVSPGGRPLRLLRGGGDQAAAALARDGRGHLATGILLLVLSHALLAAILLVRPS